MRYGDFKKRVAEAVIARLEPIQKRFREITAEAGYIDRVLTDRPRSCSADRRGYRAQSQACHGPVRLGNMIDLGIDVRETEMSVERTKRLRAWAILILTNFFSLACMVSVLKGADPPHLGEVQHMQWHWVSLAVVCDACLYLLHGWRWKLLLQPVARIPYASGRSSLRRSFCERSLSVSAR